MNMDMVLSFLFTNDGFMRLPMFKQGSRLCHTVIMNHQAVFMMPETFWQIARCLILDINLYIASNTQPSYRFLVNWNRIFYRFPEQRVWGYLWTSIIIIWKRGIWMCHQSGEHQCRHGLSLKLG